MHPVLRLARLLTNMANLRPASQMAKVDHGPIRFTTSQVSLSPNQATVLKPLKLEVYHDVLLECQRVFLLIINPSHSEANISTSIHRSVACDISFEIAYNILSGVKSLPS